jgi:rhodanese-related sulfurtransferase
VTSHIDAAVSAARARLNRLTAAETAAAVEDGALLVDIRPVQDRLQHGEIPGAFIMERIVLEWRLDPTCDYRLEEATDPDRMVIIFCNEGYASSLTAAAMLDLGRTNATDLIGGFHAWAGAGLPVIESRATEQPHLLLKH